MDITKLQKKIETEYRAAGHSLGWRFLYSPLTTIADSDICFLGLNPGGDTYEEGKLSVEEGSAYVDECWGKAAGVSPLQQQVQLLFDILGVAPEKVLAGNLVPFRSPGWQAVKSPKQSLLFGTEIWEPIIQQRSLLIITMSKDVATILKKMTGAAFEEAMPTGWGNYTAKIHTSSNSSLINLPHLSRFGIFGRGKTGWIHISSAPPSDLSF